MGIKKYCLPLVIALLFGYCKKTLAQQTDSIQIIETHVTASFRSMTVVNDSVVWVGGSQGKIGKTTDGGLHWQWFSPPGADSLDFRLLHAFSAKKVVAANAGSPAHIWLTNDGGKTWQQVYYNAAPAVFLDAIKFINKRKGIIVGDPMADSLFMLRTTNRGKTWHRYYNATWPKMNKGEAFFAASNSNIAFAPPRYIWLGTGGKVASVLYSRDKGKHFIRYNCPVLQGKNSTGIFSIVFVNSRQGNLAGGDYSADHNRLNNAFYSNNGGKTWQAPVVNPFGYRSCVIYVTPHQLLATGTSGTDISFDGGVVWKKLSTRNFNVMQKVPGLEWVYFAGSNGLMGKCNIH